MSYFCCCMKCKNSQRNGESRSQKINVNFGVFIYLLRNNIYFTGKKLYFVFFYSVMFLICYNCVILLYNYCGHFPRVVFVFAFKIFLLCYNRTRVPSPSKLLQPETMASPSVAGEEGEKGGRWR